MTLISKLFINIMGKKPLKKVIRNLPTPESGEKFLKIDKIIALTGKNENVNVDAVTLVIFIFFFK